tara:strand:+ start:11445 stop:11636 length:192 start_codon:yes stop_codon:yes gene_type:complete
MEDRVMYNVLKSIGSGDEYTTAPDDEYLTSLDHVGIIDMNWDNCLTDLGKTIYKSLQEKFEKW